MVEFMGNLGPGVVTVWIGDHHDVFTLFSPPPEMRCRREQLAVPTRRTAGFVCHPIRFDSVILDWIMALTKQICRNLGAAFGLRMECKGLRLVN